MLSEHALCQLAACHQGSMHGKRVGYEQVGLLLGNILQPHEVALYWLAWDYPCLPVWPVAGIAVSFCKQPRIGMNACSIPNPAANACSPARMLTPESTLSLPRTYHASEF